MGIGKIIQYFLFWRIALLFVLVFSFGVLSLKFNFLGGGLKEYLHNPTLWGWINFDGEHYFSIAQNGYQSLEYFFFPVYPLLVRYVGIIFGRTIVGTAISGLVVSNIAFLFAVVGLVKLLEFDYKANIIYKIVLLLLLFPTAFYFGSFYTESLFFAEVIWSIYFARKGSWILAGIIAFFATSTRIVGIALIPFFFCEIWNQKKFLNLQNYIPAFLASLLALCGICTFMVFLYVKTGDPFAFFTSLHTVFGEQRSESLVLLPQVFYRYFFKILPAINYTYLPQVFTTYLEIGTGILFLILTIISFFKLRISYAVFMAASYLIPTLSGSFSSFPRYALVLFPGFILMAIYLEKLPKVARLAVYVFSGILLSIATSLFIRGYWVS